MVDRKRAEDAVRELIAAMGEDAEREGLKDTPERVARMLEELTAGYADSAEEHLKKTFEEGGSALVVERDIAFSSTCEHHLMPFFGHVHIAYVPCGRVAGLSKLARTVDVFARRLQLQERMNAEDRGCVVRASRPPRRRGRRRCGAHVHDRERREKDRVVHRDLRRAR